MMTPTKGLTMPHRSPFPHVLLEPKVPHDGWTPCDVAPGILLLDPTQPFHQARRVAALLGAILADVDPAGGDNAKTRRWRQKGEQN